MIAQLSGTVASVGLDSIVVVVSGVGFDVKVVPTYAQQVRVGDELTVATSLIVREDSLTLMGFETADQRDVFTILQTVSGIGPRIALGALGVLSPDDLRRAVRDHDLSTLGKIPGVGKKSAQRMVLELGEKLGQPAHLGKAGTGAALAMGAVEEDVVAALVSMGWKQSQAQAAIDTLGGQGLGASDLLRAALLKLGGSRG
ncbi:Holliday junction branch migration protein RuvA [Pauljensenia sp. UMB1177]|uniref:Holliday junction branch migration protein RuvA n=1 Tax=Pauljensenia sp. UMB1177 TaxID=3046323 RepID=UPI000CD9A57D|nr:Holliday junction branch migration protein RuvA [Pauljensenia sp. UMB1177]MDK7231045.1 Holliday junction branch migration protein RuvA [Pauljensenia sp. UMB1177]